MRVLDELDAAVRETAGAEAATGPVRLGAFATAAAGLVPRALASLPRELRVTLREATTPALTRALRAGTLDLAILALIPPFRPPDAESPALELTTLSERELVVGVPAAIRSPRPRSRWRSSRARSGWRAGPTPANRCSASGPGWRSGPTFATSCATGSPSCRSSPPGWPSRRSPRSRCRVLPAGVAVVAVRGEPQELRRVVLARRPGALDGPAARVADALIAAS